MTNNSSKPFSIDPRTGVSPTPPRAASGFAYLWVLFAVAFLGAAQMLTAEWILTSARRERERELLFIGRQFREAIGRYYEATPGAAKQYPASPDQLLADNRYPEPRRHLRKLYRDPMTREAAWGWVRIGGRIVGIHSLSNDRPFKQANFLLQDAGFQGASRYSEWVFLYPHNLKIRAEDNP